MIAKRLSIPIKIVEISYESMTEDKKKKKYGKLPMLKMGDEFVIYETIPIMGYLAHNSCLYGHGGRRVQALINSWLYGFKKEIDNLNDKVLLPILGFMPYTTYKYESALKKFKCFLKHLNSVGEYLVGTTRTVADMYGAAMLSLPFEYIIDKCLRDEFPNVVKWYTKVATEALFVEFFGTPNFCISATRPSQAPSNNQNQNLALCCTCCAVRHKKKCKHSEDDDDDEEEEEKKDDIKEPEEEKNELDLLPPTSFDLQELKDSIPEKNDANFDDAKYYLDNNFWGKFDASGWGVWRLIYKNKDPMSENIKHTSLNEAKATMSAFQSSISNWSKYGFGVHAISEHDKGSNDYRLYGVYLWRGTDIPFFVRNSPSYQLFNFVKMNPHWSVHKDHVKGIWCAIVDNNNTEVSELDNKACRAKKIFK